MNEITIMNTAISTDAQGRFSLNDLHKAAGGDKKHQPANFLRMDQTLELISELGDEKALLTSEERSSHLRSLEPINTIVGGSAKEQGTFVAWELVYAYAMWISPKFHLHVIRTFHRLQVEERQKLAAELEVKSAIVAHLGDSVARAQEKVEFLDAMLSRDVLKSGDKQGFLCTAMDRGARDYRKKVVDLRAKKIDQSVKDARRLIARLAKTKAPVTEGVRQNIDDHLCEIEDVVTDLLLGEPVK